MMDAREQVPELLWAVHQYLVEHGIVVNTIEPDANANCWRLTTLDHVLVLANEYVLVSSPPKGPQTDNIGAGLWRVQGSHFMCQHALELADPHTLDRLLEILKCSEPA